MLCTAPAGARAGIRRGGDLVFSRSRMQCTAHWCQGWGEELPTLGANWANSGSNPLSLVFSCEEGG